MSVSQKRMSSTDFEHTLRYAFNDSDKSITMGSFVASKVGHKMQMSIIDSVTEHYNYFDGANLLYTLEVIYDNASHDNLVSVERIA